MATDYVNQNALRHQVWVNGVNTGFWNAKDLEFGSESSEVSDPEYGVTPNGGRQTGDDLELTRPWRRGRERGVYQLLKPQRGRASVLIAVHELDDYGVPTTPDPLDTMAGVLSAVTKPEGSADGDDAAELSITVQVSA